MLTQDRGASSPDRIEVRPLLARIEVSSPDQDRGVSSPGQDRGVSSRSPSDTGSRCPLLDQDRGVSSLDQDRGVSRCPLLTQDRGVLS